MKINYPNSKITYKRLGNILINDVLLIKPNDMVKFVFKKYNNFTNLIKWTLLRSFTFYGCYYFISDTHRLRNEAAGLRWSNQFGKSFHLHAPQIKEHLKEGLLLEFVPGTPIDNFTKFSPKQYFTNFKRVASILFDLHSHNYTFGDCKAENIFYSQSIDKFYFIDFEQFMKIPENDYGRKVWDITELFFYLGHIFPSASMRTQKFFKKLIFVVLNSYYDRLFTSSTSSRIKEKMFNELGKIRYTLIYATFMTPWTYTFVHQTITEWKQQYKTKWTQKN